MQDEKNLSEINIDDQKVTDNKELNLIESLIPVLILMCLLAYNIFFVEDQEWFGGYTNQAICEKKASKRVCIWSRHSYPT